MAVAQSRAGEHQQAELAFGEAARLAERLGDSELLARAIVDQPINYPAMLRLINRETTRLLSAVLEQLNADSPLSIRVRARLGVELWLDTESCAEGEAMVARAVELARSTGDRAARLAALLAYDVVLSHPDRISERIDNANAIIDLAIQLRDYRAICFGCLAKIVSFSMLGSTTHSDCIAGMMIQASEMAREPLLQWPVLGHLACKNLREAHFEQGKEYVQACLKLASGAGDYEIIDLIWPALLAVPQKGEKEELEEFRSLAIVSYQRRPHLPFYAALLACIYFDQGRIGEAKLQFDKLAAAGFSTVRRDGLFLATLAGLAEVSIRLKDGDHATELYEFLLPYRHLNIVLGPASLMGPVSYYLARLAIVLTRADAAQQHCADAMRLSRETGSVYWAALAEYEYCRLLLQRIDYSETASDLLGSLIITARNCAMSKLEQKATELQQSLANRVRGSHALITGPERPGGGGRIKSTHEVPTRNGSSAVPKDHLTALPRARDDRLFQREGDYWTMCYNGKTVRLRHLKGFGLIACLLSYPGRRFLAADLLTSAGENIEIKVTNAYQGDVSPLLDTQAKTSYRERLQQLREDLEEARSFNDQARVEKLEEEITFLTRELARALGIFGRDRRFPSDSERIRLRVTNAIRNSIKKIYTAHLSLGRHLTNSIKTGVFCSYIPEASTEAKWIL